MASLAQGLSDQTLASVKKGDVDAAKEVSNVELKRALLNTAFAELQGKASSTTNVHRVGNKFVVGMLPPRPPVRTPAVKWHKLPHGQYLPSAPSRLKNAAAAPSPLKKNNRGSAPPRMETATVSEKPQAGLPPLKVPMGAFPAPRVAVEPGSPRAKDPTSLQSSAQSSKSRRRKARKTRKTRKN